MYAVDALRQLVAKLLDRAELARFTHQGEALRPFAAVLRHSGAQPEQKRWFGSFCRWELALVVVLPRNVCVTSRHAPFRGKLGCPYSLGL